VPPPSVLSITPDQGLNTNPVPVLIEGSNFFGMPTAQLGDHVSITITTATTNSLTGTVPAGLTPGVYALTVTNPDAQFDTLSPAYTALNPPRPNNTLETGYLSTFGPTASTAEGDNDHVQVIFFEVPNTYPDSLFFRIFDADTGGGGIISDTIDEPNGLYDTTIMYTLRGYTETYTHPEARSHYPSVAGIESGTLLTQTVVGADSAYHNNWNLVFGPYQASAGELVSGRRVFKLIIQGDTGNDGNAYNVTLSTNPSSNVAPGGSRVFAYSWTFPLTSGSPQWVYPYLSGTSTFEQHNWDMDNAGTISLHTPMREIALPGSSISGDGVEASSSHSVQAGESEATWTVTMGTTDPRDTFSFWGFDEGGNALPIFTRPTTGSPP